MAPTNARPAAPISARRAGSRASATNASASAATGAAGSAGGLLWGLAFPVNKHLWTSSYVLLTAGLAALTLAAATWAVDARGWRRWAEPLVVYGTNPLVAFAGSEVLAHSIHSTFKVRADGQRMGLEQGIARGFEALGLDPRVASLTLRAAVEMTRRASD